MALCASLSMYGLGNAMLDRCFAIGMMCLTFKPGLHNACDVFSSNFSPPFDQKHIFRVFSATVLGLTLL